MRHTNALQHIVLLSLKSEEALHSVLKAMAILETLPETMDGILAFSHGPNRDFEAKSQAYDYGFMLTFRDRAANIAYDQHPAHQRAGQMLVDACRGGYAGIFVADLELG